MTDEQWVSDNEQPHDDEWEICMDMLRIIYERGMDIPEMLKTIKEIDSANEWLEKTKTVITLDDEDEVAVNLYFHDVVHRGDDMETAANRLHHHLGFDRDKILEYLKTIWDNVQEDESVQ
jgi:hypothetical protein